MSLFLNFKNKLGKSSNFLSLNILNTLKSKKVDSNTLEELESILISSDISLDVVNQLIESVVAIPQIEERNQERLHRELTSGLIL